MTTAPTTRPPAAPDVLERHRASSARWWNRVAVTVLPLVAAVGAVLSWGSLYEAAAASLGGHSPTVAGVNLAGAAFPLLVDALILGASARYVAGVKTGRPVGGWRAAAHCGIAGTVALNAAAAPRLADVPWHVTAPIVWSVLVELLARDVLGELAAAQPRTGLGQIPLRLWVTAPGESARISWRIARTGRDPYGTVDAVGMVVTVDAVRAATQRCAAAVDHLTALHPGRRHRRLRRQITRRLWAGALDPALLTHLIQAHPDPADLHSAALRAIATGSTTTSPTPRPSAVPSPAGPSLAGPSPARPDDVTPAESNSLGPDPDGPVRTLATAATGPAAVRPGRDSIREAVPSSVPSPGPVQRPPAGSGPAPAPSGREADDLARIARAVADGRIHGRVTKAKIRDLLRCSNPHAGTINTLYQNGLQQPTGTEPPEQNTHAAEQNHNHEYEQVTR